MAIVRLRSKEWLAKKCVKVNKHYGFCEYYYQFMDESCVMTDRTSGLAGEEVCIDSEMCLDDGTPIAEWMIDEVISE